jgi:hypothetical protein
MPHYSVRCPARSARSRSPLGSWLRFGLQERCFGYRDANISQILHLRVQPSHSALEQVPAPGVVAGHEVQVPSRNVDRSCVLRGPACAENAAGKSPKETANRLLSFMTCIPADAIGLIRLADDRRPIRANTPRTVHPVSAGDWRFGAGRRGLADDRGPVGSDATRAVDPIGASGGVALCSKSKCASRYHDGE